MYYRAGKGNGGCQRLRSGRKSELLFNGCRVSVFQDEKSFRSWLHISVNALPSTGLDIRNSKDDKVYAMNILPQLKRKEIYIFLLI